MHPMREVRFNPEDLGKVVFFNLDAFFHPVKTAIFAAGMEYDCYGELLQSLYGSKLTSAFEADLYRKISKERDLFVLPEVLPGSGQFPNSPARVIQGGREYLLGSMRSLAVGGAKASAQPPGSEKSDRGIPSVFHSPKALSAALILSLAIQTKVALARVGIQLDTDVYVEGGFRRNRAYISLLTALMPETKIILTSMEEASAYGAAICGKIAMEEIDPNQLKDLMEIDFKPAERVVLPELKAYEKAFLSFLE
jgi:hypothetical protein